MLPTDYYFYYACHLDAFKRKRPSNENIVDEINYIVGITIENVNVHVYDNFCCELNFLWKRIYIRNEKVFFSFSNFFSIVIYIYFFFLPIRDKFLP